MNITRNTYESFFIDYLEGNLSDNEIKLLIQFLDTNPDLEEELRDLTSFSRQQENSLKNTKPFSSKSLKKEPIFNESQSNFDELCIAFYEGLLNEKEEIQLLELVDSQEDLKITFDSYALTKAKPNEAINYPNKSSLKKQKKIVWHQYVSYAASILFVLGFIFYTQNNKTVQEKSKASSYAESTQKEPPAIKSSNNKANTYIHKPIKEDNIKIAKNKYHTIKNQNPVNQTHKTIPVSYDQEVLEDFEDNNPLSYSRKGKLAYANLSELEQHLNKIFAEKEIDKNLKISKEIKAHKKSLFSQNYGSLGIFNGNFQLATTIDPIQYRKQILGSQPPK